MAYEICLTKETAFPTFRPSMSFPLPLGGHRHIDWGLDAHHEMQRDVQDFYFYFSIKDYFMDFIWEGETVPFIPILDFLLYPINLTEVATSR